MVGTMVSVCTGAMNSLLGKLTALMEKEFAKQKNLRKEVMSITDELRSMNNFLERLADVDDLDKQTQGWRDDVRDMSYDIEDIIDDFKQHIGEKCEISGFVTNTIESLKNLMVRHRIAGRIKEMKKLLHETSESHARYKLDIPMTSDVAIDQRVVALYANAADFVGVEKPANDLVSSLLEEEKQLKVISIVGFGGLGKTTLANVAFRKLKAEFNCAAFVPVSQKPNIPKLLDSLLSELDSEHCYHEFGLNVLLDKLRDHLRDKRYFIVIDDLWDASSWDVIKYAFPENNLGSRVIVTTRNQDVAKSCCFHRHDYILNMEPLSDEDSRKLFFGRIFGLEEACPLHLRKVSVEILKKCGGLPLAIVNISSLLSVEGSNQLDRWEHVQNCLGSMSRTSPTLEGMRQILNLSYKHLPHYLKTCFLYLGMYPEDYTIRRSDLERQWTAEGFFSKESGEDLDKVARNCFNELVNRNLIQLVNSERFGQPEICCKVHDMMLDLILCKCAEENFITIIDNPNAITGMTRKARRLSVFLDGACGGTTFLRDISISQVRSLMFFGSPQKIPPLSKFKFLRVLFVKDDSTVDLTGLCKLHQLRYIQISGNCQLPTKVRGLQHLETVHLDSCASIPPDIVHLPQLLHLSVIDSERLPDGIDNMKSLQHLDSFDLATNSLGNIMGLGELTNLRHLTLTCFGSPNDIDRRMNILYSSLGKLCSLEYLAFGIWVCMDELDLSPPPSRCLEKLHMYKDATLGSRFFWVPNWMAELHNLSELTLNVGELLEDGVSILAELPSLTSLFLNIQIESIKESIVIHAMTFPILKRFELRLSCVSYLSFQAGAMPKLQRLRLEFNAQGWHQNEPGPAGMEHLLALQELSAKIGSMHATESECRNIESFMRSAMNNHPFHPLTEIEYINGGGWEFLDY